MASRGERPRGPTEVEVGQGGDPIWLWFEAVSCGLSAEAREALILRYAGGLTADEIGHLLGLAGSGVRSLISRALTAVRPIAEETR